MRNKFLSTILCLCMIISLVPCTFASDSSDFVYEQSPYGPIATIVSYTGSATDLVIPDKIDGYTVTSIGADAFCDCDSLVSVVLPEGLTTIGFYSFQGCSNLQTVSLPDSLTKIDDGAFADCEKLNSITIPKAVRAIGDYAFAGCKNLNYVYIDSEAIATIITDRNTPGFLCESSDIVGFKNDITSLNNYITSNFITLENTADYKAGYEIYNTHIHPGFELIENTPPTCVSDGLTWGEKCPDCGVFNIPQEVIPALGHAFSDWVATKLASCTEPGEEFRECGNCGEVETREIPPAHDILIVEGSEATCTTDGLTEGRFCVVCYEEFAAQDILPALGHDIVTHEAQEPTETTVGWEAYETCTRCNYTTYVEIPKLGGLLGDSDMNGVVNILDAINIVKYISGWYDGMDELPIDLAASNVNRDSSTNVLDAIYIVKHIAEYEDYPL